MKGGDAAVALWHDTARGVDASRTRKVVFPGRHVHEASPTAQSRSPYAAAVMSSRRMSQIYEMPVLPLIFDTILGLGATKPRAMCP